MSLFSATADLLHFRAEPAPRTSRLLPLVLRFEAWRANRRTARALHALDERALSDIGLSRADVEAINARAGLTNPIPSI